MNEIKINYQLREEEYLEALDFHGRRQRKQVMLTYVFLLLALALVSFTFKLKLTDILSMVFLYVLFLLLIKYGLKYRYKKAFQKNIGLNSPREIVFREDGFSIKSEYFESSIKYKVMLTGDLSDKYLLLYSHRIIFHIFPVSAFKNHEEAEIVMGWFKKCY